MFKPFHYPEVQELFSQLYNKLLNESGRGALLVATTHVEEFLTSLIEAAMPQEITAKHKKEIFNFRGPLGTFSSKIELSYVFGLINKRLYDSLTALRGLRNDAAHKPHDIKLHELNEKMKVIFDLGPDIPIHIKNISMKALVDSKFLAFKEIFDSENITNEEARKMVDDIFSKKENIEILEKQAPFWELIIGLSFVCGLMVYKKNELLKTK